MIKDNFHTHTTFCDGKNSAEEMLLTAIDKGFSALGFSGHSQIPSSCWSMTKEKEIAYFKEIANLKQKYQGRIKVFCGIEQDMVSPPFMHKYDYVIGSKHRIKVNGEYYGIDSSREDVKSYLKEMFDGSFEKYAKVYFDDVVNVVEVTKADVIGHVDLITKFCEVDNIILTDEYYRYAEDAVYQLVKTGKPFEINTGAIGRGYRTIPYPDKKLLKIIFEQGGNVMINSDCHNKDKLDCGFEEAESLAKEIGFTKRAIITQKGLEYVEF